MIYGIASFQESIYGRYSLSYYIEGINEILDTARYKVKDGRYFFMCDNHVILSDFIEAHNIELISKEQAIQFLREKTNLEEGPEHVFLKRPISEISDCTPIDSDYISFI